jgi:hypothetical protein
MELRPEAPSGKFIYPTLNQIVVEEPIRSSIDADATVFTLFWESIRMRGVLEPILVGRLGAQFVLT